MREIPLSRGLVAIVDDADYDLVASIGKWYADPSCRTFYARKNFNRGGVFTSLRMHRLITGLSLVDHVNGNGLDNRRRNLREATPAQNSMNRGIRCDNAAGYKGIRRQRATWAASIWIHGQAKHLGVFDTAEEAARAYDAAALLAFGDFARINFPREDAA